MFSSRRITMGGDVFRDEYSLAFDGTDDYVEIPEPFANATTYTVGCWIKYLATDTNDWLLGSPYTTKSFGLNYSGSHIFYREEDSDYYSFGNTSNLPLGAWAHLLFTSNATSIICYINGNLLSTITVNSTTTIDGGGDNSDKLETTKFKFSSINGAYASGGTRNYFVNCNLSDVFVYDSYMTASQVKTLYNGREPYNHKEGIAIGNLKGWWRMGDGTERGSGTTVYDMSSNSNDGTMTNMDATDFEGDTP